MTYTNFLNACYSGCSGSPLTKGGWGGQCVALFYEIGISQESGVRMSNLNFNPCKGFVSYLLTRRILTP